MEEERDGKPWYFDIKRYVVSKEYLPEIADNDKRTLRRLAAGFFMRGSILYKRNCDMTLLWCVDAREADKDLQKNLLMKDGVKVNENYTIDIKKYRY